MIVISDATSMLDKPIDNNIRIRKKLYIEILNIVGE